ncbi:hypothetical protein BGZ99_004763 [Dissophora globulifera]|uniref:Rho-GAP domain-containing protein n=1 Tax=Dissophora globulifera TaxID=979702 RepID=A0A9P6UZW8_9FUNG|nr:hypothetical protein BGZ99_004763 [Dissophora globulifera]
MDLMPIQFSHMVIMMCIEEIKLRGLRHPHLFRNAFHIPSVDAGLAMLANPRKNHLFSVKMMRIDTVAGLLTTALSRTYPPIIPPHIQEMFQNPNGRFFFELLGMLPELNRYLFVEILDLCCALVDQQSHNQISHSKLAVFPGSCCFGLSEYKPNWDARFLQSADLKKFSSAFYHAIYAYREERDLTAEQLQEKLDTRARILEQERIAELERQHGYHGAQAILRMEARIAQGLPAESPNTLKEISLYADRRERVVADDAISVLDIQLDDDEDGTSKVPDMDRIEEEEEEVENVQAVLRDLRRSVSVASLGKSVYENQPRPSISSQTTTTSSGTSMSSMRNGYLSPTSPASPISPSSPLSPRSIFSGPSLLSRSNTIARSVSLKLHPVSPGDIFGISQRAVEKRELEGFLAVARTVKRGKSSFNKRTMQQRQIHKMRILASQNSVQMPLVAISTKFVRSFRRNNHSHMPRISNSMSTTTSPGPRALAAADIRRERAKALRKELEVYRAKGLSFEEAMTAREADIKKQKRKEKRERRAEQAALAKAEAEKEAAVAAAVADAIAHNGLQHGKDSELTMEEAEILEAFDYLTDEEFREFMEIAGLTADDIEAIRTKSAALSLNKVAQDIQSLDAEPEPATARVIDESVTVAVERFRSSIASLKARMSSHAPELIGSFDEAEDHFDTVTVSTTTDNRSSNRPFNIPHMTSMDLMFKHASVVGDANLRLYPTRPSSPTISDYESDSMHGGLLSRAASVMKCRTLAEDDDNCEDGELEDEDSFERPLVSDSVSTFSFVVPHATRPALTPTSGKSGLFASTPIQKMQAAIQEQEGVQQIAPQQQVNNHQYRRPSVVTIEQQQAMPLETHSAKAAFVFETVVETVIAYEEDEVVVEETKEQALIPEETEEEAELRELLEAMSEEERSEFLRLSNQEIMSTTMAPSVLVQH